MYNDIRHHKECCKLKKTVFLFRFSSLSDFDASMLECQICIYTTKPEDKEVQKVTENLLYFVESVINHN